MLVDANGHISGLIELRDNAAAQLEIELAWRGYKTQRCL